jgi:hypothetical protein
MSQIKKEVKKVLRDYLIKVQRDIPVDLAILYGSQAKGQAGLISQFFLINLKINHTILRR